MAQPTLSVKNKLINLDLQQTTHILEVKAKGIQGVAGSDREVNDSFETISKNLGGYSSTLSFDANNILQTVTYTTDTGTIIKTFSYDANGILTSVVLSGSLPDGVQTTKNFSYDSDGNLTGVSYS